MAALAQFGPLIGTPRAAKRLVNLYKLIRAGLVDDEVDELVADAQYRALAIVLAAQVGFARKGLNGARSHALLFMTADVPTWRGQFLSEDEYVTHLTWPSGEQVIDILERLTSAGC